MEARKPSRSRMGKLNPGDDTIRQRLANEAKQQIVSDAYYFVSRDNAEKAFANWTYPQIVRWASDNGLVVDFLTAGTIRLSKRDMTDKIFDSTDSDAN